MLCSILKVDAQNWSGTTPGDIYYNQGNVGVGLQNLSYKFSVGDKGNIYSINPHSAGVNLYSTGNYAPHYQTNFSIYKGIPGSGELKLMIDQNGNMGVGLMNLTYKFSVGDKGNTYSINPHSAGVDLYSTGNYAPHYQTNFSVYKGIPGSGKLMLLIDQNGNVGVGTNSPKFKLDVIGTIRAREIKVDLNGADFVFENGYNLRPLTEVESFVKANKHLPDVAPASEMQANGVSIGEMNARLLQKVEELTLYTIQLNKRVAELERKNKRPRGKR